MSAISMTRIWVAMAALLVGVASAPTRAEDVAQEPVTLGAFYIADLLTVAGGGVKRGSAWLGRADVTLAIEGSAIGLEGTRFFGDVLATQPREFSGRFVGDGQTVSNVQADSAVRPFEAWIEAAVAPDTEVKAGLVDLNTEFDIQSVGALFLNSSHGIGPDFSQSGVNGPSIFPASASAIMVRHARGDLTVRLGVFDGVAGSAAAPRRFAIRFPGSRGALLVGEVERKLGRSAELQVGAWRYTSRFDRIEPGRPRAVSQGAYALVEGPIGRGIKAWVRVGVADDAVNPIGLYAGGGFAHGSERSRVGIAFAHARLGAPARRHLISGHRADRAETAIELTWARAILPGVIVQPDVQYVINPGWNPATRNAIVVGTRLRFAWQAD